MEYKWNASEYARIFDNCDRPWSEDETLRFLRTTENYANEVLRVDGYLYLNDLYSMLGIPRCEEFDCLGWDRNKEGHVEFGLIDFYNTKENGILLDFNVDGYIGKPETS